MAVNERWTRVSPVGAYHYKNFTATTAGATVGDASAKVLHGLTVNAAGTSVSVVIYDGQSTGGTKIATITPAAGSTYLFDVEAPGGLFVVITGTMGDLTLTYL